MVVTYEKLYKSQHVDIIKFVVFDCIISALLNEYFIIYISTCFQLSLNTAEYVEIRCSTVLSGALRAALELGLPAGVLGQLRREKCGWSKVKKLTATLSL
jgi:hypothetical protein